MDVFESREPLVFPIESAGADRWTAGLGGFGGTTLGCATRAAALTCEGRVLHSLHTYFLRAVPADRPVELVVERMRDGRRFAHRRARVERDGRLLCELVASFAAPGAGPEHQDARPEAGAEPPEALPSEDDVARREGWKEGDPSPLFGPLEWRWVGETPWTSPREGAPSRYSAWVRARYGVPADPPSQAAALAFLADYHSHMSVERNLGRGGPPVGYTSLDQVLWVHRDLPWDDWRLLTTECDVMHAGRALSRRTLFTRDGLLVASMAQEQLIPGAAAPDTR